MSDELETLVVEESDLVLLVDMACGMANEISADLKNNDGKISQETIDSVANFMQQLDRLNRKLDDNGTLQ